MIKYAFIHDYISLYNTNRYFEIVCDDNNLCCVYIDNSHYAHASAHKSALADYLNIEYQEICNCELESMLTRTDCGFTATYLYALQNFAREHTAQETTVLAELLYSYI